MPHRKNLIGSAVPQMYTRDYCRHNIIALMADGGQNFLATQENEPDLGRDL